MNIKIIVISFVLLFFVGGCTSPFIAVKPDSKTGQFQTMSKLTSNEIDVFVPIDNLDEQRFNVLIATINVSWDWSEEYGPYAREMLENSGLSNVIGKTHLENFIIANNLGEKIPSLNNRIGYNQLSKYIGNYLIIASDLQRIYGDWWEFSLTVYDPVTSSTKFHASKKAINWVGMEKPILLPVFNSLKRWVDESKLISIKPSVDEIGT